jgi:hypothetical protein
MGMDTTTRRRWFGASVLLAALAMLVAGETVLDGRLSAFAFLFYWLCCLLLTATAIVVAFADVLALQRRTHQERRDLLQNTIKEIETEARARHHRPKGR